MAHENAPSLGVVFRAQFPPEALLPAARTAESAGLDELWLWEDCFAEAGISAAAAVLGATDRLRVGIGLLPAPLRNVGLTAMELATLYRLFPDRLDVGVGHGVQSWMEQTGARVESPLTLLREYIVALRTLLNGEHATMSGRYVRLADVALEWPPAKPPQLLVGATGPRSMALAAELADGVILTAKTSLADMRAASTLMAERAPERARRVVSYLLAATGPDAAERLDGELRRGTRRSGAGIGVAGDAGDVAAAVRRCRAAGAGAVVLQPTADEPDLDAFIRFAAEDVRPRAAEG